jgi:hypothetical protein
VQRIEGDEVDGIAFDQLRTFYVRTLLEFRSLGYHDCSASKCSKTKMSSSKVVGNQNTSTCPAGLGCAVNQLCSYMSSRRMAAGGATDQNHACPSNCHASDDDATATILSHYWHVGARTNPRTSLLNQDKRNNARELVRFPSCWPQSPC